MDKSIEYPFKKDLNCTENKSAVHDTKYPDWFDFANKMGADIINRFNPIEQHDIAKFILGIVTEQKQITIGNMRNELKLLSEKIAQLENLC